MYGNMPIVVLVVVVALGLVARCDVHRAAGQVPGVADVPLVDPFGTAPCLANPPGKESAASPNPVGHVEQRKGHPGHGSQADKTSG
jgi:hypothetical protein